MNLNEKGVKAVDMRNLALQIETFIADRKRAEQMEINIKILNCGFRSDGNFGIDRIRMKCIQKYMAFPPFFRLVEMSSVL